MARKTYTLDSLKAAAAPYQTRAAFRSADRAAYAAAHKRGLLDTVCAHMIPLRACWTLDSLMAAAAPFQTRTDFYKGNRAAYSTATGRGLLDTVCAHMPEAIPPTDAEIREEAARYPTRTALHKASSRLYTAALGRGLLDDLYPPPAPRPEKPSRSLPVTQWSVEQVIEAARRFSTRTEFMRKAQAAYRRARVLGVLGEACAHMEARHVDWQSDMGKIADAARVFASRRAFEVGNRRAYYAAVRSGRMDEICAHMDSAQGGFDPSKPAVLYYLRIAAPLGDLFKIGVTNHSTEQRFRHADDRAMLAVLDTREFPSGREARRLELEILTVHAAWRYIGHPVLKGGGNSELFIADVLHGRLPCNGAMV